MGELRDMLFTETTPQQLNGRLRAATPLGQMAYENRAWLAAAGVAAAIGLLVTLTR
jgi:hypothetical protein